MLSFGHPPSGGRHQGGADTTSTGRLDRGGLADERLVVGTQPGGITRGFECQDADIGAVEPSDEVRPAGGLESPVCFDQLLDGPFALRAWREDRRDVAVLDLFPAQSSDDIEVVDRPHTNLDSGHPIGRTSRRDRRSHRAETDASEAQIGHGLHATRRVQMQQMVPDRTTVKQHRRHDAVQVGEDLRGVGRAGAYGRRLVERSRRPLRDR